MTMSNAVPAATTDASGEQSAEVPLSPAQLIELLDEKKCPYKLHHHVAVFTVEEAEQVEHAIAGAHCRNLFLRDHKGRMALLSLRNETKVDLKRLSLLLNMGRLSFGSPERLWQYLGVRPGSVCPYSILNDKHNEVEIYLDATLFDAEIVNFHPLLNTMTLSTHPNDLKLFLEQMGRMPHILDFAPAAPQEVE